MPITKGAICLPKASLYQIYFFFRYEGVAKEYAPAPYHPAPVHAHAPYARQ